MKNSEILARAMAEATGVALSEIKKIMAVLREALPPGHKLDTEVPEAEAARLLESLRAEQGGIRQWLLQGYLDAVASGLPPRPFNGNQPLKNKGH